MGGSNCDPSDPTCGNPQPPDQPGCDWNADPTCGGMVGMDSCTNPFAASCGNPWEAQGLPWGSPGLNMSPADDPCVYMNGAGNGVESIDYNSSKGECGKTGGTWVPAGSAAALNPDGTIFVINNPSFYIGANALNLLADWIIGAENVGACVGNELAWNTAGGAAAGAASTRTWAGTGAGALGGLARGAVQAARNCGSK